MPRNRLSILANVSATDIRIEPYPHFIIENALAEPIYAQLAEEYPDAGIVINGRTRRDTAYDYPACLALHNPGISPLWKEFMAFHTSVDFYREVLELMGTTIRDRHPDIERQFRKPLSAMNVEMRRPGTGHNLFNRECDVSMECQFFVNLTENGRTVRGPHVDRPSELYAALLYFRSDDDKTEGSNLQICRALDPEALYPNDNAIIQKPPPNEVDDDSVEVTATVEYAANTLVFFLNSAQSLHGVSPRPATSVPRRHVNFTADLYNMRGGGLFQIQQPQ